MAGIVENIKHILQDIGVMKKGYSRRQERDETDKFAAALESKEFPSLELLMAIYTIPEFRGLFYEKNSEEDRLYSVMISFMFLEAVARKASQITITPKGKMGLRHELEVQYKIGNEFIGPPVPFLRQFYPDFVCGFKKLANLDTNPLAYGKQEGKASIHIKGMPYDLTVRTESTPLGEIIEISGLEKTVQETQQRPKLYISPTQTI